MNSKLIEDEIMIAYNKIKDCGLAIEDEEGKWTMNHAYRGQISTFGTAVMNGNVVSAIAFFSREQRSNSGKMGLDDVDRRKLLKVIAEILLQKGVLPSLHHGDDLIVKLVEYANKNGAEAKEQVINASIAIKLAINLFPKYEKSNENNKKKTNNNEPRTEYRLIFNEQTPLKSPNMNYMFNVEYFKGMQLIKKPEYKEKDLNNKVNEGKKLLSNGRNKDVLTHTFTIENNFDDIDDIDEFELCTIYPGLLTGIGNEHDIAVDGAFKCGFSFDYVTGNPYIPGSELKGMLRSCFPSEKVARKYKDKPDVLKDANNEHFAYIRTLLNTDLSLSDSQIIDLTNKIFDNNDVFLGAYPVIDSQNVELLSPEYITPHSKDGLKNPVPISLLKVKPNVKFSFKFILTDSECVDNYGNSICVTKEQKLDLFQKLILDLGIGAKTHVGFGGFMHTI